MVRKEQGEQAAPKENQKRNEEEEELGLLISVTELS